MVRNITTTLINIETLCKRAQVNHVPILVKDRLVLLLGIFLIDTKMLA